MSEAPPGSFRMKQNSSNLEETRRRPTRRAHCYIWLSEVYRPADLGEETAEGLTRVQISVLAGNLESDPECERGSDRLGRKQKRRLLLIG